LDLGNEIQSHNRSSRRKPGRGRDSGAVAVRAEAARQPQWQCTRVPRGGSTGYPGPPGYWAWGSCRYKNQRQKGRWLSQFRQFRLSMDRAFAACSLLSAAASCWCCCLAFLVQVWVSFMLILNRKPLMRSTTFSCETQKNKRQARSVVFRVRYFIGHGHGVS